MLPISVLIPTRNAAAFLPRHLESIRQWSGEIEEIVVVDSFSNDGTPEQLKSGISHPRLQIHQHPPGLYQSWNFGIRQLVAKYAYVSTTGDTISLQGLRRLVETAEQFQADVVLSRAEFVEERTGLEKSDKRWPLHDLIDARGTREPEVAPPVQVLVAGSIDAPEGILGSSASNLYRTETLKRLPFPTEYGHVGDTAWGIQNAFKTRIAITPEMFSTFLIHPNEGVMPEDKKLALATKLIELAQTTAGRQRGAREIPTPLADVFCRLPGELKSLRAAQDSYDAYHRGAVPWILNPAAWRARSLRNHAWARVLTTKRTAYQACGLPPKLKASR